MPKGFNTIISLDAFDGGLNSRYEPQIIADNESQDCRNVVYDDLGGCATRQGYAKLNTALVNSSICDGLFTCNWNAGTQSMVGFWGNQGMVLSGTTFQTIPSAQGVFTSGTMVNMAMYQNVAFFGAGSTPYKYNGTYFTRHGVPAPNSTVTAYSIPTVGNLNGNYHYKVTYVNSYSVQGDVSAANTTTFVASATGEKISVQGIPVAPTSFGVSSRKLYRSNSGTAGTFKLITTIADNTTTSYLDNTADASVGVAAPTDNGVPPNYNFIVAHQERLFVNDATNPQYLWYSELGEPFTFASTNFIKIADGDGEAITGLAVQGNMIVVGKTDSVWLIYMPDTDDANWVRLRSDSKYGVASHRSFTDYQKQLMFLGQKHGKVAGFFSFQGTDVAPDTTILTVTTMHSESKSDRIHPDIVQIQDGYKSRTAGIHFDNKLWIATPFGAGVTANSRVYQFDYVRRDKNRSDGAWVPFTGITAAMFTVFNGLLYFASSAANGFVYQLEDGSYDDDGSAIDSYFTTKEFDGGKTDRYFEKDFREARFTVELLGDWNMRIGTGIDSQPIFGGDLVDLDPGGALWGTAIWDVALWSSVQTRGDIVIDLGTRVGKRITFKFDNLNTAGQAFKVVRGTIFYNKRGLR